MNALTEKAREQLSIEWRYEIQHSGSTQKGFVDSCKLDVSPVKAEREIDPSSTESIVNQLQEHLGRIHESVISARDKLAEICNGRRKEAEEMKNGINRKLEEAFKQEDARIQAVVKVVKERIDSEDPEEVKELGSKASVALLTRQKYSLSKGRPAGQWDLVVRSEALPNFPPSSRTWSPQALLRP